MGGLWRPSALLSHLLIELELAWQLPSFRFFFSHFCSCVAAYCSPVRAEMMRFVPEFILPPQTTHTHTHERAAHGEQGEGQAEGSDLHAPRSRLSTLSIPPLSLMDNLAFTHNVFCLYIGTEYINIVFPLEKKKKNTILHLWLLLCVQSLPSFGFLFFFPRFFPFCVPCVYWLCPCEPQRRAQGQLKRPTPKPPEKKKRRV